jgi:ATP-binding cassette subfamily G (WHITE) protein 2 (SNQ2)
MARHRLSPFSYLVEGLMGQGMSAVISTDCLFINDLSAVGQQQVNCASIEFVTVTPPSGQTCAQYMSQFISSAGGYLTNPNATSACQFCSVRTTDQLIGVKFDIFYNHHWRNFGLMMAYVIFNVRISSTIVYLANLVTI